MDVAERVRSHSRWRDPHRWPRCGDMTAPPVGAYRAGIVGAGFMGAGARAGGPGQRRRGGRRGRLDPAARRAAADDAAAPTRPTRTSTRCWPIPIVDGRPRLHPQPPAHAGRAGRARRRQARRVREAARHDRRRRRGAASAARRAGRVVATVPFVYRFHPMVREARERVARRRASARSTLAHGGYLQDWLLAPDRRQLAGRPGRGGATRAFGDIGLALVRPARVRDRRPDHRGCRRSSSTVDRPRRGTRRP